MDDTLRVREQGSSITKKVLDMHLNGKRSIEKPRGSWRKVREDEVGRQG